MYHKLGNTVCVCELLVAEDALHFVIESQRAVVLRLSDVLPIKHTIATLSGMEVEELAVFHLANMHVAFACRSFTNQKSRVDCEEDPSYEVCDPRDPPTVCAKT